MVQQLKAEASEDKVKMYCVAESMVKEVVWYKGSKKLTQGSHYQIQTSADGTCCLFIYDVSESDQGEYTCEITTEGGMSKTSFSFTGQVFQSIYSKVTAFVATHMAIQRKLYIYYVYLCFCNTL